MLVVDFLCFCYFLFKFFFSLSNFLGEMVLYPFLPNCPGSSKTVQKRLLDGQTAKRWSCWFYQTGPPGSSKMVKERLLDGQTTSAGELVLNYFLKSPHLPLHHLSLVLAAVSHPFEQ